MPPLRFALRPIFVVLTAAAWSLGGCGRPDAVNAQLRKEKQTLENRLADAEHQVHAAQAQIRALEAQSNAAAVPTLPQERLKRLFTVHGIELGRATGGVDLDRKLTGDEALKIYLTPIDQTRSGVKATGRVTVDALQLMPGAEPIRLGHWEWDSPALFSQWRSLGPLEAFVLTCPWQTPPTKDELTVQVTFKDELTGRVYDVVKQVKVNPPPATQPTTAPSTRPQ
jgi:hypothetical protein